MPVTRCPYCDEEIRAEAEKCRHCGEFLDRQLSRQRRFEGQLSPFVAGFLSFLLPGLGQFVQFRTKDGILWFIVTVLGYALIVPGIILHIFCIANAVEHARKKLDPIPTVTAKTVTR